PDGAADPARAPRPAAGGARGDGLTGPMPRVPADASRLLRRGLLEDQVVAVASPRGEDGPQAEGGVVAPDQGFAAAVIGACSDLSAHAERLDWEPDDQEA